MKRLAALVGLAVMLLGLPLATARRHGKPAAEGAAAAAPRPTSGAASKARELLLEGSTALVSGDLAAASVALTEAYRLAQLPAALYQLGALAAQQGRLLAAQDFMGRYLADPAIETTPDSAEQAEARRVVAQPSPAHCSLLILGDSGTQVLIDGNLVGVIPLSQPLLVTPGEHKVGLEADSRRLIESVPLKTGRLSELRFDFAAKTVVLKTLPAVLIIDNFLGLDADQTARFTRSLQEAIRAEHLSPLRRAQALEALHNPELAGCSPLEASCQVRLGKKSETATCSQPMSSAPKKAGSLVCRFWTSTSVSRQPSWTRAAPAVRPSRHRQPFPPRSPRCGGRRAAGCAEP